MCFLTVVGHSSSFDLSAGWPESVGPELMNNPNKQSYTNTLMHSTMHSTPPSMCLLSELVLCCASRVIDQIGQCILHALLKVVFHF